MSINIGTKIGAVTAHCAEAEPSIKFTNAQIKIKGINIAGPVIWSPSRKLAPLMAKIVPRLDHLKKAMN